MYKVPKNKKVGTIATKNQSKRTPRKRTYKVY